MKNLILLSTTLLIVSCGNSQKDRVLEHVQSKLKDPKSFELIKYELQDTIYESENLAACKEDLQMQLEHREGDVEMYQDFISHGSSYWSDDLKQAQTQVKKLNTQMDSVNNEITKLKKSGVDPVFMYKHFVSCYGVNHLGMRVINDLVVFEVVKDGSFEVHQITLEMDFK